MNYNISLYKLFHFLRIKSLFGITVYKAINSNNFNFTLLASSFLN